MAGTLNKVMLIGHLGDDVKMHFFEGGGAIGRFPLATNEDYVNRTTGEKVSNTEWHNIVVRNKAAEVCEKYLRKGDLVYIEGRIKTRKWVDDQRNERYTTEIQVTDFTFLPKGGTATPTGGGAPTGSSRENTQSPSPQANQQPKSKPEDSFLGEEEDDLPF